MVVYPQPMHVGFVGCDVVLKLWFLDIANNSIFLLNTYIYVDMRALIFIFDYSYI